MVPMIVQAFERAEIALGLAIENRLQAVSQQ
jgi:hypothetical protein